MAVYPHAGVFASEAWPNQRGQLTPGALVGIYNLDGTTLADLWDDRDRTNPVANPITLNAVGNNDDFYADPTQYLARRIVDGVPQPAVQISVPVDPADAVLDVDGPVVSVNARTGVVTGLQEHLVGIYDVSQAPYNAVAGVDFGAQVNQALRDAADAGGGLVVVPPSVTDWVTSVPVGDDDGLTNVWLSTWGDQAATIRALGDHPVIGGAWVQSAVFGLVLDADGHGSECVKAHIDKTMVFGNRMKGWTGRAFAPCPGDIPGPWDLGLLNRIRDNEIEQGVGYGIEDTYRMVDTWIEDNNIGSTLANVKLEGGPVHVYDNHFDGSPINNVLLVGNRRVKIKRNHIEGSLQEAVKYVQPDFESADEITDVEILDNTISNGSKASAGTYPAIGIYGKSNSVHTVGWVIGGGQVSNEDAGAGFSNLVHIEHATDVVIMPIGGHDGCVGAEISTTDVTNLRDYHSEIDRAETAETAIAVSLMNHLNDMVDAHDASAISNIPAGTVSATDVQAAINELGTEKATAVSVTAEATARVAADLVLQTRSVNPYLEGIALAVYGASYEANDNQNTVGARGLARFTNRNRMGVVTNNALSGSGADSAATRALGNTATKLTSGTKTAYWLSVIGNTVLSGGFTTAKAQASLLTNMRALIAAASSVSRVETSTLTPSGTWLTDNQVIWSAGSARYTTTDGAYLEGSLTFPASGILDVVIASIDNASVFGASFPGSPFTISVDGVQQFSGTTVDQVLDTASVVENTGLGKLAIPVTATPGAHTVRITKGVGVGTTYLYTDCVLVRSATPPLILVPSMNPVNYAAISGAYGRLTTQAEVDAANAAVLALIQSFQAQNALAAKTIQFVDMSAAAGFDTATMLGTDGLHPNDKGADFIATQAAIAAAAMGWTLGTHVGV